MLFASPAFSEWAHDRNYDIALAMDHEFGILDGIANLPPDFLYHHQYMFKSKKHSDPDTPNIKEALGGPHRDGFLEAMKTEIQELVDHGTWSVIKRSDIVPVKQPDGTFKTPQIIPTTWAFKIKRLPSGLM
jgi:hypothetical protein